MFKICYDKTMSISCLRICRSVAVGFYFRKFSISRSFYFVSNIDKISVVVV